MNNSKYFYKYLIILLVNTIMVSLTTFLYIAFDVDYGIYTIPIWLETFITIIICYFVIPFLLSFAVFKGLKGKEVEINKSLKERVRKLPSYAVLTLIPGYFIWYFAICLPDALSTYSQTATIIKVNVIAVLAYTNIINPLFIGYMLTSNIRKEVKKDFFNNYNVLFDPGITRVWHKLLLMVLVISVFPVTILYLNSYINFNIDIRDGNRLLGNLDLFYVAISIVISLIIITKDITDPINKMISSFKVIRNGDFSRRMAVTTQNEMGVLTQNFNLMADGLEDREKIKNVFGQYVSPKIAEKILHKKSVLEGEERDVTVLFTDIRSYTTIAEKLTPAENVSMLNEYFNVLIDIVKKHNGVVNKFIGDAIMVIFNAPHYDPYHSLNAVNCGKEIIKETNKRFFGSNFKLQTRVGINTGGVVAGSLGGMNRFEYTIIGDTVNTAQRLEQFNKVVGTQLLLSHETATKVYKRIKLKKVGKATVKGKKEKVLVYTTV